MSTRIGVFGAGSWGTALAILLARNGHHVALWGRDPERIERMRAEGCNSYYLPQVSFPPGLNLTAVLDEALRGVELALVVVPSEAFRGFLRDLRSAIAPGVPVVWATKGLEPASGKLLHQVGREELDVRPTAVISGPTFAREVAAGMPTAITAASESAELAGRLAALLHGQTFRVYTSSDVVGVETGGALKNVLAIAAGVADGLGFGANTRAALITRGLVEIVRLGERLGGNRDTFMGLAGLGDIVLTCTDDQSRNRRFGLALGQGEGVEEALEAIGQVVEGMRTARIAHVIAQRNGIEMPICEQVHRVIYDGVSAREAVHALLLREQKPEDVD
jgi:glycerol-3-phosphate dehydrogenase (NAD(P)+)